MTDERKKILVHLFPDNNLEDDFAFKLISDIKRNKGEYLRKCLLTGIAISQVDSRLISMISCLLDDKLNQDTITHIFSLINNELLEKAQQSQPIKSDEPKTRMDDNEQHLDNAAKSILLSD